MLIFFFNDTATTEIYTLSLHDALPIWQPHRQRCLQQWKLQHADGADVRHGAGVPERKLRDCMHAQRDVRNEDRKSTRLNSSHANISYAVFCLKKKRQISFRSRLVGHTV